MPNRNTPLYLTDARYQTNIEKRANLSIGALNWLFGNAVVELVFKRKNISTNPMRRRGNRKYRRMLATCNWDYLKYYKTITGFQIPSPANKKGKAYYANNSIKLVYDMIDRDWKCFSTNNGDYYITAVWMLNTADEWKVFMKDYASKRTLLTEKFQDNFANATY